MTQLRRLGAVGDPMSSDTQQADQAYADAASWYDVLLSDDQYCRSMSIRVAA
jgi:hypothetical protein